jgi:hypothetical protein
MVNCCDFVIALVDLDIHVCGTYDEIGRANDQKKPVLVWCPQGTKAIPDWLFGKLPNALFFDSVDDVLSYLRGVAFDDDPPPSHNRWLHFKLERMYPPEVVRQIMRATSGVI